MNGERQNSAAREQAAYRAMHETLRQRFPGQHVAIFQGELVDHDSDGAALSRRIYDRFPDDFVLIRQVEAEPERVLHFRSPRLTSLGPADHDARDGKDTESESTTQSDKPRLPTWREMNMDTSPEAEAVLFQMLRETPAWRKLELMESLNRTARELAVMGLRRRYPDAAPAEIRRRLADMILGEELAAKVYGPLPA